LKICFISFEYPPFIIGGAGIYAQNLVNELAKLGHDVYVIAPITRRIQPNTLHHANVSVKRVPIINVPSLRYLTFQLRFKKAISELEEEVGKIDIYHSNGIGGLIISNSKYPLIVTAHHAIKDIQQRSPLKLSFSDFVNEENPIGAFLERKLISRASKIISVSNATKKFLIEHYNIPESNINVVHNGIYADHYTFSEEEINKVRSLFGIDNDEKLILCTPRRVDEPRKGIKYLLAALSNVFSHVSAKCIITGSGKRSGFSKYLSNLPQGRVQFPGLLDEKIKRRLFAACDIFVLPSLLEGCPLAILEAMAAGVPIVSTNVGGIPELVKERNGILVDPQNPIHLAEAMLFFLLDEEKSRKIGRNNYNDVRHLFSWEKTARLTENVYKTLIIGN
jgi:glycosyltransferase involved in cell wall biosynthesis